MNVKPLAQNTAGPLGVTPMAAYGIMPDIKADRGVRTKIAALVARDFATTPMKVAILGDSNSKSGYYAEGNTTQRLSTYERLSQYLNSPATGYRTLKRVHSNGIYFPFGQVPAANHSEERGNW